MMFLYRDVLGQQLPWLDEVVAVKDARHLPSVLTASEVGDLLHQLSGTIGLVASLLYGTGMRVLEALRLRVKDVGFERREIIVRDGKGSKNRVTVLPVNLMVPRQGQMSRANELHDGDLVQGLGGAWVPDALAVKYPNATEAWGGQWVFPGLVKSADPHSGEIRRHHLNETSIQKSVTWLLAVPASSSPARRTCCAVVRDPHAAGGLRHQLRPLRFA